MIALSPKPLVFQGIYSTLNTLAREAHFAYKKIIKPPCTCAHKYHKHAHLPMTRHDPDPPTAGKLHGLRQKQSWNAGNDKVASRDQQTIVKPNHCAKKMNVYWWIERTNIDCHKNTSCPDENKRWRLRKDTAISQRALRIARTFPSRVLAAHDQDHSKQEVTLPKHSERSISASMC
jgi:hypothetical protein